MKVEIREDSVHITGYVNAVERLSKPIRENLRGKIRIFLEKIKAGVFKTALSRNDDVKVLLNHNHDRVLANTKDGSAKLEEDNIGLRAEVTITDKEVVEKARNNQLVGWSFGFYANSDEMGTEGSQETRTITDLDLIEVSILDDTKSPAYYGTSIEARSVGEKVMEYRASEEIQALEEEAKKEHEVVYETTDKMHQEINKKLEEEKFNLLVDAVYQKVLEKMNGTGEEETTPEEKPVEEVEARAEETAKIDYSSFEERLSKLN